MTAIGISVTQTGDDLDTIASLLASDHSTGGAHARLHLLEYGDYKSVGSGSSIVSMRRSGGS